MPRVWLLEVRASRDLSVCFVKIFLVSEQGLGVILYRVLDLWGSMPSF